MFSVMGKICIFAFQAHLHGRWVVNVLVDSADQFVRLRVGSSGQSKFHTDFKKIGCNIVDVVLKCKFA